VTQDHKLAHWADLDAFLSERGVKHFTAREIDPRGNSYVDDWHNIIPTLHIAEVLRAEFGPTKVNSGYRDPDYNAQVGGAPISLHVYFNALDLVPRDGTPEDWSKYLKHTYRLNLLGGIGLYPTFLHIDTRKLVFGRAPAFWRG
jgi:uncharacterized protein YcbK (DUF882 family)